MRIERKNLLRDRACRDGSAMILVVVLTVLLSIIGLAFLMTSRIDEMSTSSIIANGELTSAVDAVVQKINTTLVEDLVGPEPDETLLSGNAINGWSNECFDYPSHGSNVANPDSLADPWLATLEPVRLGDAYPDISQVPVDGEIPLLVDLNPDAYVFPHISDIYWQFGELGSKNLEAKIISEHEPIVEEGDKADADGDGVADSRWVKIPGISTWQGKDIFTAVRIVDNGGMININTAHQDPTGFAVPEPWDGSKLTHVNLKGIKGTTEAVEAYSNLHLARCGSVDIYDPNYDYHDQAAMRTLNPVAGHTLFDLTDELAFRNRFFLSTSAASTSDAPLGADTRSSNAWPITLNPGASTTGKRMPYYPGDDINDWFYKVSPDIFTGTCNRRHLVTTYNFDRNLRPYAVPDGPPDWFSLRSGQRKTFVRTVSGVAGVEDQTLEQLASAIYMGMVGPYGDNHGRSLFGEGIYPWQTALQLAMNLIDYQDSVAPDGYTTYTAKDMYSDSDTTYYGFEGVDQLKADTVMVSAIGYGYDESLAVPAEYFAIEIFNPDDDDTESKDSTALGKYEIRILDGGVSKGSFELTTSYSLNPSASGNAGNTIAYVFSPTGGSTAASVFNPGVAKFVDVTPSDPLLELADDYKIIVVKMLDDGNEMPVDSVTVPSGVFDMFNAPIGGSVYRSTYRRTVVDGTNLLLPAIEDFDPWSLPTVNNTVKIASAVDISTFTNASEAKDVGGELAFAGFDKVDLSVTNAELATIGEIENVFAVGCNYTTDLTGNTSYQTFLQGLVNSHIAMSVSGYDESDLASFGKLRFDFYDYHELFNYLTCFDPSVDGVDNDGDPATLDYPIAGNLPENNNPWNYEQRVAGRININTAPWYVIAQLPWVNPRLTVDGSSDNWSKLARAIVAWRDKTAIPGSPVDYYQGGVSDSRALGMDYQPGGYDSADAPPVDAGFSNIAQLVYVTKGSSGGDSDLEAYDIRRMGSDYDNTIFPPLPRNNGIDEGDFSADTIANNVEERDLIFSRISNLVTVRSDVFTAYIVVRLGKDGPQKRMMAIFDRSNVYTADDKPKLVALQAVPDPR